MTGTTDIVRRLRQPNPEESLHKHDLWSLEAADEIERLRAENARLRESRESMWAHLCEARARIAELCPLPAQELDA